MTVASINTRLTKLEHKLAPPKLRVIEWWEYEPYPVVAPDPHVLTVILTRYGDRP